MAEASTEGKVTITKALAAELDKWAEPEPETEFVETGNIGFDMAISNGKGLPLGNSILFWGAPGCGKTTLFADVARRLIKSHKDKGEVFKVLYLAVEGSKELMKKLGLREYINSRDFIYIERRFTWSQIETLYEMVLNDKGAYKGVKLIVIDSVNNVLSSQNEKNSVAAGDFGTKARERNNFWGKYLPICKQKKISTFMVAQMRQKQGAGPGAFVETEKAAASFSDLHNADVILKCKRELSNADSVKTITKSAFNENKAYKKYVLILDPTNSASKNRIDETYKTEILLEKGVGAHNYYVVRKMLLFHGFVKKDGAYYHFTKEVAEGLKLPEKKMYVKDLDTIITENIGALVALLKETDCYTIVAKDPSQEISGDQDPDNLIDEDVDSTYSDDSDDDDED